MSERKFAPIVGEEPRELIDPEGEGIYYSAWDHSSPGALMRAAQLFFGTWREWRNVEHTTVFMRPSAESDEWLPAPLGKHPRYWRLNLPRRWRPVPYVYCTPAGEAKAAHEQAERT